MTDAELQRIMKKGGESKASGGGLVRRESLAATPPLPPLSPEGSPQASPQNSPSRHRKYNLSYRYVENVGQICSIYRGYCGERR